MRCALALSTNRETNISFLMSWQESEDIGEITDDGLVTVRERDQVVCSVPVKLFIDACPTYHVPANEPLSLKQRREIRVDVTAQSSAPPITDELLALLAHPNIGSRRPVWEQYDHTILTNTVMGPGEADAAVMRVKGTSAGIALSMECNSQCSLRGRPGVGDYELPQSGQPSA